MADNNSAEIYGVHEEIHGVHEDTVPDGIDQRVDNKAQPQPEPEPEPGPGAKEANERANEASGAGASNAGKLGDVRGGNNIALACVEAGHYIGTGFLIAACIQAENMVLGIVLFLCSEALIAVWSLVYVRLTPHSDNSCFHL